MRPIRAKVLSYKTPQRYAVRRVYLAAQMTLSQNYPDLSIEVEEVRERSEIEKITPVVIYPSLVVNDRLVCVGRFPSKEDILGWFQQALLENAEHH
jgi:disulfide oxidoreductase YuzD